MKKIILMLAFSAMLFAVNAQEKPTTGDYYNGLTRPLTFDRMIPLYPLS